MIEDFYTQTAQRFTRFKSTPSEPKGKDSNIGDEFKCWINNRGGNLKLDADKQTKTYDCTLKCSTDIYISDIDYIRHISTGIEYKVLRVNNASGYMDHHQTVYLEVNK